MASKSKQARLAKKAEKGGKANGSSTTASSTGTPMSSNTPMTNLSANTSVDDLPSSEMAKLALAFDRSGSGVLTSDAQSRDIQAINYTLSFHGRVLIESGNLSLNYGQR